MMRWLRFLVLWCVAMGLSVGIVYLARPPLPVSVAVVGVYLAIYLAYLAFWAVVGMVHRRAIARFVGKVQAQRPEAYVFGSVGSFFSPWGQTLPAGSVLVADPGRVRKVSAFSVDDGGLTLWVAVPEPVAVFHLPWEEVGNVAVERRRVEFSARPHSPARSVIRFSLRDSWGDLPCAYCVIDSWRGSSPARVAAQEALVKSIASYRTGWSDTQHYTI